VTATIVFALAHCALFGVKYCCEPYKPVGSRLEIVTFAYGSAFVGLGDAVAVGLLLAAAAALAELDAGADADADAFALAEALGAELATGAETSATRRDERAADIAAECAFLASSPAAAEPPPPDDEPMAPYEAAAAVLVGTTIAAVTTAAKAVDFVLGLRCAPMKLCCASPPTAYRVS
jgi:hypothetical protein